MKRRGFPNGSARGATYVLSAWLLSASLLTLSNACGGREATHGGGAAGSSTPQAAASPIPWKTIEPPTQVGAAAPGAPTPTPQPPTPVRTYKGKGVIRLINLKEGWLELDHEDIPGFMPAMQMEWSVRNRALLKSVQVGDTVSFEVEDDNGTQVITALGKV